MASTAAVRQPGRCQACFGQQYCCSNPHFLPVPWPSAGRHSTRARSLLLLVPTRVRSFLAPRCGAFLNTGFHRDPTAPSGGAWILMLGVSEEESFSSSFAAAAYLNSINFPSNKKVYIIGEAGIQLELEQAGINYVGGPEDGDKIIDLSPGQLMERDPDVAAVVVGFDRYINYYKLQYATRCVLENPGCMFIATNCDAGIHLTESQEWPGAGCMVGAIKGSTKKEPLVIVKPSTFMMDHVASKPNIKTSQICMMAERLETDILFGQNGGCATLLVLSGVTTLETLQSADNKIQPDYYTNKISDLLAAKNVANGSRFIT